MSKILKTCIDRTHIHTLKAPIKWMAPESITKEIYSSKSDVWSAGAALIELWSGGLDPHHGLTNKQVVRNFFISPDFKPAIPKSIPENISRIIFSCFREKAEARPTAEEIKQALMDIA